MPGRLLRVGAKLGQGRILWLRQERQLLNLCSLQEPLLQELLQELLLRILCSLREPLSQERLLRVFEVPQVCKRKGIEVLGQPEVLLQKRRTWNDSIS